MILTIYDAYSVLYPCLSNVRGRARGVDVGRNFSYNTHGFCLGDSHRTDGHYGTCSEGVERNNAAHNTGVGNTVDIQARNTPADNSRGRYPRLH